MLGNIIALVVIVASGLVGFVSFKASSITFVALLYSLWLIIMLSNIFTKPVKHGALSQSLHPREVEVYQRYHLYFWFPSGAQVYSAVLNSLRVAGLIWGGICLWNGLYWLAGLSLAYFFITSGLIVKLNPWLYMGTEAQKGNQVAIEQISLIESVQAKREVYNDKKS